MAVSLPVIVGNTWFNSQPLAKDDLTGKVVLIDFWTYSCVNCQHTLPYIREWWRKYKDRDFLIIGVHAPEFEFEKNPENVRKAIRDLGVEWPVVLDNEHANWNNFANRYWPAKYLADANGKIVYTHFGEGAYRETEQKIQELLMESAAHEHVPSVAEDEHSHGSVCFIPTPETYCGYTRGKIAQSGGYREDEAFDYARPESLPEDSIALAGKFVARAEYVEPQEPGAELLLRFRATEVNLVLHPGGGDRAAAETMLNGKTIPDSVRGRDVSSSGEVVITSPTLYNVIRSNGLVEGMLSVRAKEGKFQAYAFTFSGCS